METKSLIFLIIGIALTTGYVYSLWSGNSNTSSKTKTNRNTNHKNTANNLKKDSIFSIATNKSNIQKKDSKINEKGIENKFSIPSKINK